MKTRILILAGMLAVFAACSSTPERNSALETARGNFAVAQSNNDVRTLAADELRAAEQALRRAESRWSDREPRPLVDHLAYLSIQRTAIATQTAAARSAQAVVTSASAERDSMLLTIRTNQAAAAQRDMTRAQQDAARSDADRAAAQQQLARSQQDTAASNAAAATARAQTTDAQQQLARAQQSGAVSAAQSAAALAAANAETQRSAARLAELEGQLRELNARPSPRGMVVTLGDVLFNTGQADLLPGATANMEPLADFLKRNPDQTATIEGHTDSVGTASSNYSLSQRRADSVMRALVSMGTQSSQLTTRAFGPDNPVASNETQTGRQMNRRVEIVFPQ